MIKLEKNGIVLEYNGETLTLSNDNAKTTITLKQTMALRDLANEMVSKMRVLKKAQNNSDLLKMVP